METLFEGLREAVALLVRGDPYLYGVALLSLQVSISATVISMLFGMPVGLALGLGRFRGRSGALATVNAGMGIPPVVVGLLVWVMLNRAGPLGAAEVLFTPSAMVAAQVLIATPVIAALTAAAIQHLDPKLELQVMALGASAPRTWWTLIREARLPLLAAVMAAFGAVISEVGAVLMVGGNLLGRTRVLTTAIVLETQNGEMGTAWALAIVLLALILLVNLVLTLFQQREAGA